MSDIHIHLHFHPGGGDVPTPLFNQLKDILTMNFDEVTAALNDANTKLTAANDKLDATKAQFDKGINEVILAIQNSGSVPQTVVDAVNSLKTSVDRTAASGDALAGDSQQLDDLNPDTPPT
jgi:hypothetical protein